MLPAIFFGPTSYDWFYDHLSAEYGLEGYILYHMETLPKPLSLVKEVSPAPGLAIKYLLLGERGVDYSAMNDQLP